MNFDSDLADSKVACGLLIHLSRGDQEHHLLLARRQCPKSLPHVRSIAVDGAPMPVPFDSCQDGSDCNAKIAVSKQRANLLRVRLGT